MRVRCGSFKELVPTVAVRKNSNHHTRRHRTLKRVSSALRAYEVYVCNALVIIHGHK